MLISVIYHKLYDAYAILVLSPKLKFIAKILALWEAIAPQKKPRKRNRVSVIRIFTKD